MELAEETKLNNQLLNADVPDEKQDKKPKRNSKDDLTKKILKIVEKYEIRDFEYTDTKMKRMSKTECDGDVR